MPAISYFQAQTVPEEFRRRLLELLFAPAVATSTADADGVNTPHAMSHSHELLHDSTLVGGAL